MARFRETVRDNRLQFRGVYGGMLRWIVAEPCGPHRHPHETERAERDKNLPPRQEVEQPEHQCRRQAADEVRTREEDALDRSPFAPGNPAGKRPRDARPGAGFTGPEEKPDDQQDGIAERGACCRREARPPDHDTRQHGPRALPVCPPRRGNLEQRICQLKDCEDVTHLDGRQSKVAHDPGRQARDAGAIQVRNHRKRGAEGNDAIPRVSGRSHSRALYANFTSSSSMANANQHGALLCGLRFPGRGPRLTRTGRRAGDDTLPVLIQRRSASKASGSSPPKTSASDRPYTAAMQTYELRQSLRIFRREPGLAAAAVITLALGIGANTALFALVEAVLLRPLPFDGAEALVVLRHRDVPTGLTKPDIALGDFVDLRARQRSLESLAGFSGYSSTFVGGGEATRVEGASATPDALPGAAPPACARSPAAR